MGKVKWIDHELKVRFSTEEVSLLPKEYQLLQFLWNRPFQVFSRDSLLDAVWSMENPTDRTVDDHIYRLRKKIRPLSSIMSIATVRGQGYILKVDEEVDQSPLVQDEDVATSAKVLFHKYHLYGQGKALKLLEENQDVFGFELDAESQCYLHFMKGDFWWFLEDGLPFWERCYYLLHIYSYIQPDREKSFQYFKKALTFKHMPEYHKKEIRLLNLLSLLIFTKRLDEAENHLIRSKKEVEEQGLESMYPLILMTELYVVFLRNDKQEIEEKMTSVSQTLEMYPYSREQATFMIMKAIQRFLDGEEAEADRSFQEGIKLFKEAQYVPGLMISLNVILFFIREFRKESERLEVYENMWHDFAREYHFHELSLQIGHRLDFHLN